MFNPLNALRDSAISALSGAWSQSERLLRLTTPLGADVLMVERLHGIESMEDLRLACKLEIMALSTDADITLKSLLGQPVLLELLTATSRTTLRPFHGHITEIESVGANGGLARYRVVIEPWTAFLAYGRDSAVFQDMSVLEILDSIFKDYEGQGSLVPRWRQAIADSSVYPKRSLTTQYQESDLAFVQRLMAEEGLFAWVEHTGNATNAPFGEHSLVIADHNDAFVANSQSVIAFTQSAAVMENDSMDRWRSERRWQTNGVDLLSWDYRQGDVRAVSAYSSADSITDSSSDAIALIRQDAPGLYAYETREQGQRIAERQLQAIEAYNEVFIGAGTVRSLAPATTFSLQSHASNPFEIANASVADTSGSDNAFVVLRVHHLAHNNLSADLQAQIDQCLGVLPTEDSSTALFSTPHDVGGGHGVVAIGSISNAFANSQDQHGQRPLYRNRIDAIRSSVPYRNVTLDSRGQAHALHAKPTVYGQQTAIVVGPAGQAIYTDRDHRIKVQFHWQRGEQSHSRLSHPNPDGHAGAPANELSGTWVRVAATLGTVAGDNWGSHAIPRIGQEVVIDFIEGDIDRPIVVGAVYNGVGQDNAQPNQISSGAGSATGNAPSWFPGTVDGHAHPASLSGIKTQSMSNSQEGAGAYNQLVFDDSPGQSRTSLQHHAQAHQGTAELNLGALRHQTDNQRLDPVGFGAELKTQHSAAIRAGQGMLISSDARRNASGTQLDSREAQNQIEQSHALQVALATTAQKHNAKLKDDKQKDEPDAAKLPALAQMAHSSEVIQATATGSASDDSTKDSDGGNDYGPTGGQGQVTAYSEPQLQLSSPAGIVASTPKDAILSAGNTSSITAGNAINIATQGNLSHAVKGGISLFTYGKVAKDSQHPNTETGIKLHAATGKVSLQSQSDATKITASKSITVNSISKGITIGAKEHVLLTAAGAGLKIEGGNITLQGTGNVVFKGGKKNWDVAGSSSVKEIKFSAGELKGCSQKLKQAAGTGGALV